MTDVPAAVTGLNWYWIVVELIGPPIVATLLAYPFWRYEQPIFGNLVGTVVIFGTAFGLILREYIELDRLARACIDAGTTCFPHPPAFTRFAIYAFIGLFEVIALFSVSLKVDEKRRRRGYDPEWR